MPLPLLALLGLAAGAGVGTAAVADPNIDVIPNFGPNKNDVTSADFANQNRGKESYRMDGTIYDYAGDVIGTYDQPNQNTGGHTDNTTPGNLNTGGTGGRVGDANEVAYWSDQQQNIQRLLNSVDTTKSQGLERINSAYNDSLSQTNDAQSKTLRNYGIQEADTGRAKVGALDSVDTQARTGYENLQRILGLSNAGRSAVAEELVPWAVSKEATGQRNNVVDTFGTNLRNLDIAKKDAEDQYGSVLADLAKQKNIQTEDFERGVETSRQSYQQQLADAASKKAMAGGQSYMQAAASRQPFTNQVSQTQSVLDGLFNKYKNTTLAAKPVDVQKVNLSDYTVDPAKIGQSQSQGFSSDVSQYLPWLKDKERTAF